MKKSFLLTAPLLWVLVVAPSCKKENEPQPPRACNLTAAALETPRGLETVDNYEYNAAGQLTKHTHHFDAATRMWSIVEYNAAGQISRITQFSNQQTAPLDEFQFEYRDNGRTVIRTMPARPTVESNTFTLEFNANDQLVKYAYKPNGVDWEYLRHEYDAQGNLLKVFRKDALETSEYLLHELDNFDDKIGFFFQPRSLRMYRQLLNGTGISSHNALRIRTYNPDGSLYTTETLANEYNADNYIASKQGNYGGSNYRYVYTYECAPAK